jgi:PQQ-dependent catabolism-associated CXXCW motif protein
MPHDLGRRGRAALLAALVLLPPAAGAAESDMDPVTGYRVEHYRAPTPEAAPGARRIDLAGLDRLRGEGAVLLLDVIVGKGLRDARDGQWRASERHDGIEGSHWLPELGRGRMDPALEAAFRATLEAMTSGKDHPIVVFCLADCWMSWNAARRLALWGHTRVHWFSEGLDAWGGADRPLVPLTPRPVLWPKPAP